MYNILKDTRSDLEKGDGLISLSLFETFQPIQAGE